MISALSLRYFGQVVRSGSFRAAAISLCVAPSAISRQIAVLEEELDAPLLERGRGRSVLKLMSAGEILIQLVNSTDNEMERVRSDIEALKGIRRGPIHLGAPETFSRDFLPGFFARFNERYPGITYRVSVHGTPRLIQMVAADELDVALSFHPPLQPEVKHIYEHILPTRLLVSSGHPLFHRKSVRLSDCAEYGLALPDIQSVPSKFLTRCLPMRASALARCL